MNDISTFAVKYNINNTNMLLRVIINNLFSFKEQTEFNMFTNKSQKHLHHKKHIGDISYLKMAALYGANGAGKSNFIKALDLLVYCVKSGKIVSHADELKFKLDENSKEAPISIGVEFVIDEAVFYYSISFDQSGILYEYLSKGNANNEQRVFERSFDNGKEIISFYENFEEDPKNKLFIEMLSEKFVGRNELLLYILNGKYAKDFIEVPIAYQWLTDTLKVIRADDQSMPIAHVMEANKNMLEYANNLIGRLSTGVDGLSVHTYELQKTEENTIIFNRLDKNPNTISETRNGLTGDIISYVKDGDKIIAKKINTSHLDSNGNQIEFGLGLESDGTQRLVDFIPVIYGMLNNKHVYVIDEIERSIHPIIIKELISLISDNKKMNGQIIFSTHESCLLDQRILRTDEIWFAQKDSNGATQLYSLSDYNVHSTANIENGYLNGRYGGIPFLSNLSDIHWADGEE